MGAFFSKQKTDPNDYEKILSELDESIQKAEVRLSEIKIRERRTGLLWIIYGTIAWAAFLLYSFITLHGDADYDWDTMLVTVVPVILLPLAIYGTRRFLKWFYTRKQTNEEANLGALRAQQKLKVEELKKKTSYYTTKSLLERYDPTAAAKKKQKAEQARKAQAMATGSAPPGQGQQLRQRNGAPPPQPPQQQLPPGAVRPPHPQDPARPMPPNQMPPRMPVQPQQPRERQWYDKLVDALVGEEGPETKYALICRHCFSHNGLVLPQEIDFIQYTCPTCKQFNPPRKLAVAPPSPRPPTPGSEQEKNEPAEPTTHESPAPKEAQPYKIASDDGNNHIPNDIHGNAEGVKAS